MRLLDLFSGIGGFSLAASWVWGDELEIVSFVEIDPFCQKVLKKHWPDVPIIQDIREFNYEKVMADAESTGWRKDGNGKFGRQENYPRIDLVTGGFPCQPFSCAGKRAGKADDRFLWPEMLRVIQEFHPAWVIGENVAGIIGMELENCIADLESASYEVQPFVIPACAVDAPHRRDRVWIVAHRNGKRQQKQRLCLSARNEKQSDEISGFSQDVADTEKGTERPGLCEKEPAGIGGRRSGNCCIPISKPDAVRCDGGQNNQREKPSRRNWNQTPSRWLPEPGLGRVANGIPNRVDRLKSLGNAIVPQVAAQIMWAIRAIEERNDEMQT